MSIVRWWLPPQRKIRGWECPATVRTTSTYFKRLNRLLYWFLTVFAYDETLSKTQTNFPTQPPKPPTCLRKPNCCFFSTLGSFCCKFTHCQKPLWTILTSHQWIVSLFRAIMQYNQFWPILKRILHIGSLTNEPFLKIIFHIGFLREKSFKHPEFLLIRVLLQGCESLYIPIESLRTFCCIPYKQHSPVTVVKTPLENIRLWNPNHKHGQTTEDPWNLRTLGPYGSAVW